MVHVHHWLNYMYTIVLWGAVCVKIHYWQAFRKVWGFMKVVGIYINHYHSGILT